VKKSHKSIIVVLVTLNLFFGSAIPTLAYRIYRVQPGNSIYQIATWYGLSVEQLAEVNRLPNKTHIIPRQALLIPEPVTLADETLYTVQPYDTLKSIATKNNTNLDWLIQRNNLSNGNEIFIGQMIKVPKPSAKAITPLFTNNKSNSNNNSNNSNTKAQNQQYIWNIPDLIARHPNKVFLNGPTNERKVALTFDDGPDTRYTTAILDLLGAMGVKATFFVKGNNIPNQEWVLTRMIREGHLIGNHSFTHPNLRNLSLANLKEEIKKTEQTVAEVTGRQPAMVRPPYGEMSEAGLDWLVKEGYSMVNWSVDSEDWRSTHEDQILIKTLPNLRPGSIILLHSAGGTGQDLTPTVKATEDLIYTLWGLGYQIVPLNELLKIQPYK